ncbi:MAG: hypothetical protein R3330_02845 [Saprospiraceae bacterium]|nr:hypothetical protein [Saprospiraceae bacterium]
MNGSLNWTSDTIKALLVTSSYTFDVTDNFVSDITNELTDGSYARVTLGSKSIVEDDTGNRGVLKAAPADFGSLDNETPGGIIVYKEVTNDADSPLISYENAGFGAAANGLGYVVNWGGVGNDEVVVGSHVA